MSADIKFTLPAMNNGSSLGCEENLEMIYSKISFSMEIVIHILIPKY